MGVLGLDRLDNEGGAIGNGRVIVSETMTIRELGDIAASAGLRLSDVVALLPS